MSSLSTSLKNSYQRWLCPYEEYLRLAKPGVHQQIELENGGPFTPSPAPSPMKRSNVNTPSSLRGDSPARFATDALQTTMNGHGKENERDVAMSDAPTTVPASGFTAVNPGGFTAVNTGGFTSVNNRTPVESAASTPPKQNGSPFPSVHRPSMLGPANALKRRLSSDSLDSARKDDGDKDDGDSGSRRSKRLKKGKKSSPPDSTQYCACNASPRRRVPLGGWCLAVPPILTRCFGRRLNRVISHW